MTEPQQTPERTGRRAPDVLNLVVGVVSLTIAVLALAGWSPAHPVFDPRWLFSALAVLLGVLLLGFSGRRNRRARARSKDPAAR